MAGKLGQGEVRLRVQTLQHLAAGGRVFGNVLALWAHVAVAATRPGRIPKLILA